MDRTVFVASAGRRVLGRAVWMLSVGLSVGCGSRTEKTPPVPVFPRVDRPAVSLVCDSILLRGAYVAPTDWRWNGADTLVALSPKNKDSILFAFAGDPLQLFATGGSIGGGPIEYRKPFLAGSSSAGRTVWVGDRQLGRLDRWRIADDAWNLEHQYRIGGPGTRYSVVYDAEVLNDSTVLVKYDSGEALTLAWVDFVRDSTLGSPDLLLRPKPPGGARMFYDFSMASVREQVVLGYLFMDRIERWQFEAGRLVPVWAIGERVERPDERVAAGEVDELTIGYTDLRCSDSLIYALYQGCKTDDVRSVHSAVEVYDFCGQAVSRWDLGRMVSRIAVDESRRLLYALGTTDNDDVIYRYRLPERPPKKENSL